MISIFVPAGENQVFQRDAFNGVIGKTIDLVLPTGMTKALVVDALVCDDGCGATISLVKPGGDTNDEQDEVRSAIEEVTDPEDMDCQHFSVDRDPDSGSGR